MLMCRQTLFRAWGQTICSFVYCAMISFWPFQIAAAAKANAAPLNGEGKMCRYVYLYC